MKATFLGEEVYQVLDLKGSSNTGYVSSYYSTGDLIEMPQSSTATWSSCTKMLGVGTSKDKYMHSTHAYYACTTTHSTQNGSNVFQCTGDAIKLQRKQADPKIILQSHYEL